MARKNWLNIRVKTEQSKIRYTQAKIVGFPNEVTQKFYFQELQKLTAHAADVMRHLQRERKNYTPTGERRKAAGKGIAGRQSGEQPGDLFNKIKWEGYKDAEGKYRFRFGWLDGEPGYAIFQEYGTSTGVRAMNSLIEAREAMRRELKYLANGSRGTRFGALSNEFKE